MNCQLPDVLAGFRKGRGHTDQIDNIFWIMEKAREFQKKKKKKNIYFCFIDYTNAFNCLENNNLLKILKEMGRPEHLTCLLRNLYAGQEATVRTGHGTTDMFQIGKGVRQITRPFRYDLNKIPYDYTVEVRNRFKGLDLIERVPDELWNEVRHIVQETGIKTIPIEKKCKKAKWLSGEA